MLGEQEDGHSRLGSLTLCSLPFIRQFEHVPPGHYNTTRFRYPLRNPVEDLLNSSTPPLTHGSPTGPVGRSNAVQIIQYWNHNKARR